MYCVATKAQVETIIAVTGSDVTVFSQLLNNVTAIGMGTQRGWLVVQVAGAYPKADLLASLPSAMEVATVHD